MREANEDWTAVAARFSIEREQIHEENRVTRKALRQRKHVSALRQIICLWIKWGVSDRPGSALTLVGLSMTDATSEQRRLVPL